MGYVGVHMSRIKHWLALLRISNLPTVWSNALAGSVMGFWISAEAQHDVVMGQGAQQLGRSLAQGWPLLAGFSLIYVGGMAMNDAMDAPMDARARPERPIPAGAISRRAATTATVVLLLAGLGLLEMYRQTNHVNEPWVLVGGLALIVAMQAYNVLHAQTAWGMAFMAACRGLVTWTAGIAYTGPYDLNLLESAFEATLTVISLGHFGSIHHGAAAPWALPALAIAIGAYTLGISWVARGEDAAAGPGRKRVVMGMIAAIPVVDAAAMGLIGQGWVAGFCVGCALLALAGQRYVSGT